MNDIPEQLKEFASRDVGAEKIARVYAEALLNVAQKQRPGGRCPRGAALPGA